MLYREWAWSTSFRQIYQYSSQRTAQILTCLYTVAAPVTSATSAGHNVLPATILLLWLSILRACALAQILLPPPMSCGDSLYKRPCFYLYISACLDHLSDTCPARTMPALVLSFMLTKLHQPGPLPE